MIKLISKSKRTIKIEVRKEGDFAVLRESAIGNHYNVYTRLEMWELLDDNFFDLDVTEALYLLNYMTYNQRKWIVDSKTYKIIENDVVEEIPPRP